MDLFSGIAQRMFFALHKRNNKAFLCYSFGEDMQSRGEWRVQFPRGWWGLFTLGDPECDQLAHAAIHDFMELVTADIYSSSSNEVQTAVHTFKLNKDADSDARKVDAISWAITDQILARAHHGGSAAQRDQQIKLSRADCREHLNIIKTAEISITGALKALVPEYFDLDVDIKILGVLGCVQSDCNKFLRGLKNCNRGLCLEASDGLVLLPQGTHQVVSASNFGFGENRTERKQAATLSTVTSQVSYELGLNKAWGKG
jgi:hypothetical protein